MSLKVLWSDRLDVLAEQLFKERAETPVRDPFSRICIVVGDMATRNWLKSYFLIRRRAGNRRIFANMDFKPLPEFVNDWLAAMCKAQSTLLTGGPGTGKTHTIARAVRYLQDSSPVLRLALAAPTGKAAARMTESMTKAGVVSAPATTIHSLLGSRYDLVSFRHGCESPLLASPARKELSTYTPARRQSEHVAKIRSSE